MLKTKTESEAKFKKLNVLLCTASAFAIVQSMPAMAQDADPIEIEDAADTDEEAVLDTVTITGIRSSIASAQRIKRNADTFVDAITSEDIGALPDRSVTEALQRVPGVSISRFAAADDPDHFSIEGSGVVVRGLTFVRSEINGRDTFTANNGRALSFSDISPEMLGSVQVFKNQTADLIEGGIAGSVNLVTRKPFDSDGQKIAGTLEYSYTDFREEWSPTGSLLYSNTWDTDAGRFGFLISGVTSELKTRSDGTQVSSFVSRTDLAPNEVWVPEGAVVRTQDYDRERQGIGTSMQWENPDRTMLATFEFLRSEATTSWNEHASEIATDNIGDTAFFFAPGTAFGFGSDDLFTNGTISAPLGWRSDQNTDPRTPIYGLQSNNVYRGVEQETMTQDTSINFKWSPADRWSINLDYQHVESTTENLDFGIWSTTYQDLALDLRGDIPDVTYLPPSLADGAGVPIDCSSGINAGCPNYFGTGSDWATPSNSFWRAAMDHVEDSEGEQDAFRADVEYDFEDDYDWLKSVRFGARYAKRDQTTRFSTYNWGALSEIWGNGGPVWMDEIGAPQGLVNTFNWDNFQRGETVSPPPMAFFALNAAQNYDESADFADSVVALWLSGGAPGGGSNGWQRLNQRPGVIAGTPFLPGEITEATEEVTSFYALLNFGSDDAFGNGMSLDGNVGLRYTKTEGTTAGAFQYAQSTTLPDNGTQGTATNIALNDCIPDMAGANVSFFCTLTPAEQASAYAFLDGATIPLGGDNEYEEVLPSLNLKLGLSENQIIRFGYSKALSRPDIGFLRATYPVSAATQDDPANPGAGIPAGFSSGFYGFQTSGGNPFLKPITSDQFDLSYEWYFDEVGSFTATAFYKEIDGIIVSGSGAIQETNNGETYNIFITNQPTNSDETAKVKGFELAYNQFYDMLPSPWDGFGVQATYTYINSSGVNPSILNNTIGDPASRVAAVDLSELPLQGLSENNFNFSVIYEKGPISTRLAYNWRDDYLVTARDVITPFHPIFQNASGQLDGSFFYTVNENFKIGVQGANLLNDITETESYLPNSNGRRGGRSWFQNDRRITISGRFNF